MANPRPRKKAKTVVGVVYEMVGHYTDDHIVYRQRRDERHESCERRDPSYPDSAVCCVQHGPKRYLGVEQLAERQCRRRRCAEPQLSAGCHAGHGYAAWRPSASVP